jgi:hypothetical protein
VDLRTSTWAAAAVLVFSIASEAAAEICLDVKLRFAGRHVSAGLVESMQREVSSIWNPYGVKVQWSAPPGGVSCTQALGSFDVLVDVKRLRASGPFKPVLGGTWMAPSGIDRAPIRIDRDATEQLIRSLAVEELYRRLGRSDIDSRDLGRALGRVLAHEIGHLLLGTSQHQRRGLMRSTFSAGDLVDPHPRTYDLSSDEVERLRERENSLRTRTGVGAAVSSRDRTLIPQLLGGSA